MKKNSLLSLFFVVIIASCSSNDNKIDANDSSDTVNTENQIIVDSALSNQVAIKEPESSSIEPESKAVLINNVEAAQTKTATINFVVPPGIVMKSLDLGIIEAGKEGFGSMCLENTGTDTLWVSKVVMSNPKLYGKISYPKIGPGVIIGLIITTDKDMPVGEFNESASVYFKDIQSPKVLPITGTIK